MKRPTNKMTLAAVLGRQLNEGAMVWLKPEQLRRIDLGSASIVKSITVKGVPNNSFRTKFEKSGSHWKIGVSDMLWNSGPEECAIWNAALRLATMRLGKKLVKSKEGEWIQRLLLPLHRDGDVAIEFVTVEVMPVINEARKILVDFAISGPKPPEVEVK